MEREATVEEERRVPARGYRTQVKCPQGACGRRMRALRGRLSCSDDRCGQASVDVDPAIAAEKRQEKKEYVKPVKESKKR